MGRPEGQRLGTAARGPFPWVDWAQYVVLGLLIAFLVTFTGTVLGGDGFSEFAGGALLAGFLGLLLLVFGPTRLMTGLFLVSMVVFHQFHSVVVFPAGGVEWHPRELLLFLFLAHAAVQLVARRVAFWEDPVHLFMAVYAGLYVLTGAVGLAHQYMLQEIIQECRYPIFLAAYPALLVCVRRRPEIFLYSRLLCLVTAAVAAASVLFFLYTLTLGSVINVQNAYGEFVQRQVGPYLIQSVRANGHLYFEVGLVMLVSLLACPAVRGGGKLLCAALAVLFATAIVITMMRTAYVAVALSLGLLVLFSLPRAVRSVTLFAGLLTVSVVLVLFGLVLYEGIQAQLPDLEVSLKGRVVETAGAWTEFVAHPIVGVGMGRSFEAFGYVAKTSQLSYAQTEYQTLHNVWMYFLFKGGLAGILLAVGGLGGLALRGVQIMDRMQDPLERFYARGLAAAFAGQLAASLAMPRLTYPQGHVFVAMVAVAFLWLARQPAPPPGTSAE